MKRINRDQSRSTAPPPLVNGDLPDVHGGIAPLLAVAAGYVFMIGVSKEMAK